MNCTIPGALAQIPAYFRAFQWNKYMYFYIAVTAVNCVFCAKLPIVELFLAVPTLLLVDRLKLFINVYFPEGPTIRLDESHFDELVLVKIPVLTLTCISGVREMLRIVRDVRRTSKMQLRPKGDEKRD